MDKARALELLELLKGRLFSHDSLAALSEACRRTLTNRGHKLPADDVISLFVIRHRSSAAASSIDAINGDARKHAEIEATIKPPLLAVLENLVSGNFDDDAIKRLIVTRITLEPDETPH